MERHLPSDFSKSTWCRSSCSFTRMHTLAHARVCMSMSTHTHMDQQLTWPEMKHSNWLATTKNLKQCSFKGLHYHTHKNLSILQNHSILLAIYIKKIKGGWVPLSFPKFTEGWCPKQWEKEGRKQRGEKRARRKKMASWVLFIWAVALVLGLCSKKKKHWTNLKVEVSQNRFHTLQKQLFRITCTRQCMSRRPCEDQWRRGGARRGSLEADEEAMDESGNESRHGNLFGLLM